MCAYWYIHSLSLLSGLCFCLSIFILVSCGTLVLHPYIKINFSHWVTLRHTLEYSSWESDGPPLMPQIASNVWRYLCFCGWGYNKHVLPPHQHDRSHLRSFCCLSKNLVLSNMNELVVTHFPNAQEWLNDGLMVYIRNSMKERTLFYVPSLFSSIYILNLMEL